MHVVLNFLAIILSLLQHLETQPRLAWLHRPRSIAKNCEKYCSRCFELQEWKRLLRNFSHQNLRHGLRRIVFREQQRRLLYRLFGITQRCHLCFVRRTCIELSLRRSGKKLFELETIDKKWKTEGDRIKESDKNPEIFSCF